MTLNSPRPQGARSACAWMWLSLWLASTVVGCTWEPIAREADPVLVISGPARVVRVIDVDQRYALAAIGESEPFALHIVHLETRESCVLPAGAISPWWEAPLTAPNLRGDSARAFQLPFFIKDGDEEDVWKIYYTDEKCVVTGPLSQIKGQSPNVLQLRSDNRTVSLVRDAVGTLRLVDPWTNQVTKIADKVADFTSVQRSDSSSAPEALWLIEDEKLTQRALDGTLLLSLGSKVSGPFAQTLRDQLRVAYVDDGNLYEAKGPQFAPVLIAESACVPLYQDNALDLWLPCADRQLVRINLTDGKITRFGPKVFRSYVVADVTFEEEYENVDDDDRDSKMFVSEGITGTTPRVLLDPRPNGNINVVSGKRLMGLSRDARLGIWTLGGQYTAGYLGTRRLQTFRDQRTGQLLWLVAYAVEDEIGTVAVVDQRQLEGVVASIQADAGVPGTSDAAVPAARPLVIAERSHFNGYRVFYPAAVHEPLILSLEPPITVLDKDAGLFTGALNAHLLSADISSFIDDGVHSYEVVNAPVPGILYGILQGPRAGLWFAAL